MKNAKSVCCVLATMAIFFVLSLSCASTKESAPTPPPPEPKTTVMIDELNQWLKNQEVSLLANNSLTSDQLMAITKLCISEGEISNVSIAEENAVISYAVLNTKIIISETPLSFMFSYSISKAGSLKMRITNVSEVNPTNSPFSKTIKQSYLETYKASVIKAFQSKMIEIGNTVLARSADFA